MDDTGIDATGGLSRRTALKALAAGTTAVWSAPALLSAAPRAAAGSPDVCGCPAGRPKTCQEVNAVECPDAPQNFSCFCWERAEGGTVCGTFANTSTCNTDAECPSGESCVVCSTASPCACAQTGRACSPPCTDCVAPFGDVGHATSNPPAP